LNTNISKSGAIIVASRVFAIPFDHNNCCIEIFIRDIEYDEDFGIRLLGTKSKLCILMFICILLIVV
jgi:hypothetical protein